LLSTHSGYRQATKLLVAHMSEHGGVLSTLPRSAWPIWYFYLSEAYDTAPAEVRERIRFYPDSANDGDFELLDVKRCYRAVVQRDAALRSLIEQTRNRGNPVVTVANPAADLQDAFGEAGGSHVEAVQSEMRTSLPGYQHIEVYDLRLQ
jgi:hypothetical protein